jgi:hypothetical protein
MKLLANPLSPQAGKWLVMTLGTNATSVHGDVSPFDTSGASAQGTPSVSKLRADGQQFSINSRSVLQLKRSKIFQKYFINDIGIAK